LAKVVKEPGWQRLQ